MYRLARLEDCLIDPTWLRLTQGSWTDLVRGLPPEVRRG
jgi:hypothetical protein